MSQLTGAQALIQSLRAHAVDTVFTLPGAQIMPALDALYDERDAVRVITARHEQSTTYMAFGYARATRRPGVAMVVPGPGALNAAAGLGTAYAASAPVLLISGQIASQEIGRRRGHLHEIDESLEIFRQITKWSARATRPEQIPELVREAFRQMLSGRPRPVALEIPPDVLRASAECSILDPIAPERASGDPVQIEKAARLLANAARISIIAGGGSLISGAWDELRELAEHLQAAVMLTPEAKGVFPEDHPLFVGTNSGYFYTRLGPAYQVIPETDVIIAVGTRLPIGGLEIGSHQFLIQIDSDPLEIGKSFPVEVGIEADARAGLSALIAQLVAISGPRPSRLETVEAFGESYATELLELAPEQASLVQALQQAVTPDTLLISGMTNIAYWANLMYPCTLPDTYVTSSYFGTLGYAFPTGIGAQIGMQVSRTPARRVVALCGDGGFLYSAQEMSVLKQHNIPLVTVVFNNNTFGASLWDQTHNFGGRVIGTELLNPDFMKLADAFGITGRHTDTAGFAGALNEALALNEPVLLEVAIPHLLPPFYMPDEKA